jgi:cysteine desulfurase / selenocysteine lyase
MMMENSHFLKIREEYPVLGRDFEGRKLVYLDSACSALKPRRVISAVASYYEDYSCCAGGRSSHALSIKLNDECESARLKLAQFIGAAEEALIWTSGATESLNIVASYIKTLARREVIVSDSEHHSNLLPFYELASRGEISLRVLPTAQDGSFDIDGLKSVLGDRTALVSLSQASNVTGAIFPVKQIAEVVHAVGALLSVDGSQYIATHREDFAVNDIDFLSFSLHKIGGPTGLGALCLKKSLLANCPAWLPGGGTVRSVKVDETGKIVVRYLDGVQRLEGGVQDYASIIGAGATVDFLEDLGYESITNHVASLHTYALKKFASIPQVRPVSMDGGLGSIVSFCFVDDKYSLDDFSIFLNDHPEFLIAVRYGHHCAQPLHDKLVGGGNTMRISFYVYNTFGDIDILLIAY